MAVAGEAAYARAIPAHHQPIAVVLDFVNPERAAPDPNIEEAYRLWAIKQQGK
jgi:hypothetical protein